MNVNRWGLSIPNSVTPGYVGRFNWGDYLISSYLLHIEDSVGSQSQAYLALHLILLVTV